MSILLCGVQAEGRYYSGMGLASFMAGHLYECPNGHLFVIGECGGAMQVSGTVCCILNFDVWGLAEPLGFG